MYIKKYIEIVFHLKRACWVGKMSEKVYCIFIYYILFYILLIYLYTVKISSSIF